MAGPVAGAVDHDTAFAGVGQRDDQRVIAPLALVGDVHALLALAGGFDHRAVGVDDGFVEERSGCCRQTFSRVSLKISCKQIDVRPCEAAAEVARRGGIGNAPGAQGIEIGLVVAEQFQMFQARAAGQQVVGDVQHVVGLVVGQMDLQQAEAAVDGLGEPELPHQQCMAPMPPAAVARVRSAIS